jgi:hypothetical protein
MTEEEARHTACGPAATFKLWTRLGAASLAGVAAASMAVVPTPASLAGGAVQAPLQFAQGSEGGEAGQISKDGASDDVAFLTLLGLVEGHVRVGIALYEQGAVDMAKVHMSHPGHELYGDLVPALAARRIEGFADPLDRLVSLVEEEAPVGEADAAFEAMLRKISEARATTGGELTETLQSILALIRFAGEEYAVAVKGGKVTDPREYQDAWGFIQTAKALLMSLPEAERQRMGGTYGAIARELESLTPAWPSIVPPDTVSGDASQIDAAAARIELAVLSVK